MLKNKSLAVILVISVGAVGIGIAMMQQDNSTQTQNLPYLGKYSESMETLKIPGSFNLEKMYGMSYASIDALSVRTNSSITQSLSLPAGLEVKALLTKGMPTEKARLATIIYGPSSIDYDMLETFADVMDSHGIIVLFNEERDDFNIEQWYRDVLTEVPRAQSVMVNDSNAIGVLGEPEQGKTSHLIFHDGRTQIELISAAYTLQELIQIASTL